MVVGAEQLGCFGVLDGGADFLADELRRGVVGFLVEQQIRVRIEKADAAAFGPFRLIGVEPFLFGGIERGFYRRRMS